MTALLWIVGMPLLAVGIACLGIAAATFTVWILAQTVGRFAEWRSR